MNSASEVRAAQYLRMSTESQKYSLTYQSDAIRAFAETRGYCLVRTYADEGISGLTLERRPGLQALLKDVLGGGADYDAVIAYDVSRWGRFQDPDQGAHYEFLCRDAGVQVEYCAEPFANDGSLASTLLKHLKRAMAAEFSRELSMKISIAQRGLGARGYWQGGPAGIGYRRQSLRPDGTPRETLQEGERNGVQGNRVRLVPGPPEEVALIRRIYRDFLAGLSARTLAAQLNAEGVASPRGKAWSHRTVTNILTNEKYVGTNVIGRRRCKSVGVHAKQPPTEWIRVPCAFEPLVSEGMFEVVQQQLRRYKPNASDQALLAGLRLALEDHGRLSFGVIRDHPATHSPGTYVRRFGGLTAAYALIGYGPSRFQLLAAQRARQVRPGRFRQWGSSSDKEG